ncbi:tRNA 2-selenouridine(34) synthase MnmH [Paenibacillus alkalitolerans]|uniref:tRNA 2-selenouridine(34) synthase MnmH n=1 Tax=Paenibacillus alkalitolerans TaxID=2799335 RepID=UPI0018F38BE7|nr:tRNA 2-selenouridine(34) synthase MnmH [Paenibacillus alkalitolerans]
MVTDIAIQQLVEQQTHHENLQLIDVRSPSEFLEGSIPGSINIPIFDDEERKVIGTIYKQVGIKEAKEKGLEIVSAKLPAFVKQFQAIEKDKVVFCWRGGMRSLATATFLDLMNVKSKRLSGGYRSYRQWVVNELDNFVITQKCLVINGLTGSGKTKILQMLAEQGEPVIDLEGMARHRGSVFGRIGLEANNQKTFDSLLIHELIKHKNHPYFIMEAESKRIGKITVPEFLLSSKKKGLHIFLDMPREERVRNIINDYNPQQYQEQFIEAFQKIKRHIHTPIAKDIEEHLRTGTFEQAFRLLLEYYYDPKYEHSLKEYESEPIILKVKNIGEALNDLKQIIDRYKT